MSYSTLASLWILTVWSHYLTTVKTASRVRNFFLILFNSNDMCFVAYFTFWKDGLEEIKL